MRHKLFGLLTALCVCMAFLCMSASAMTIYVETPDDETLTLEVESGDNFDNVRDKLKVQDSRTAQWWLSYQDSYLPYGRTLADYNIQNESTLRLNASKEIQASTKDQLLSAVKDSAVQVVTLTADIDIDEALTVSRAVVLDLNGYVLKYKGNPNNSVIRVADGGDLTIQDSSPDAEHKFTPNSDGLWVLDETSGTETVTGGIITGGTGADVTSPGGMASYRGGGIMIEVGGSLAMTGGNIAGCTAHDGGGIYLNGLHGTVDQTSFTMSGGSIADDCTAAGGGGGVCNETGTLYANGGEIAGDVMNGTPAGGLGTIAGSGGTKFSGKVINCKYDDDNISVIKSGTFTGEVTNDGGEITGGTFTGKVSNNGTITGGTFTGEVTGSGSITGATVVAVSASDALRAALEGGDSAVVKLLADIEIDTSLMVSRTVTLDLNGYVLKIVLGQNEDGSVIEVKDGGALTLTDSAPDVAHYYSVDSDTKLWTILPSDTGAAGVIRGGIITGGSNGLGGGVMIKTGGTLTMNGGNIAGCRVNGQGGGVYVSRGGTFTMNGGTIAGCVADLDHSDAQGGGVYVQNGREADEDKKLEELARGVFTMNDGSIIGCATKNSMGGSVFIQNATRESDYNGLFTMNGGSISDSGVTDREEYNTIYNLGTFIANGGAVTNSGSGPYNYALYTIGILETKQGFPGTEFFGAAHTGINGGRFDGGIFNGQVLNYDQISGGTFCGTVTNRNGGVIAGGAFKSGGTVINNGEITNGTFNGSVTNNGTITGGTFYGTVSGAGTIENSAVYTVSFDTDGGSTVAAQKILRGQKAVRPADPTRSGYRFNGWYTDGAYTAEYDFNTPVIDALTLTAKWTVSSSGGSRSPTYPITVPDKTENGSVTVSPKNASKGSTVTITVKPDSGYVPETISVTDKNGDELKLTDKGNGKYTFTMPGSKVEVKVTFMEDNSVLNFFYDVPNDAYYYEAVKWAAENGITGGIGNNLFAPNQPCTRAQIVTFLWRAAGSPVVNYLMPFTDVDEGAYYAEAVRWAASTGIITGLTETTFGTNNVCTRAQAAAMIYRYAQAQGKGFTGAWMFLLPFTDVPEWAYESVAWCYMNGVTTGVSETTFAPGNDCTRAQIVTFLWRAFSK